MRIAVDREKCVGGGQCVLAAPDLFDQDDEGLVIVLDDRPDTESRPQAQEAVEVCPARAIDLVEQ